MGSPRTTGSGNTTQFRGSSATRSTDCTVAIFIRRCYGRLQAVDPLSAVAIALEGLPNGATEPDRPYVPKSSLALRLAYRAAQGSKFTPEWSVSIPGPIDMASINPSGTIVAAANDKTVTISDRNSNSNFKLEDFPESIWAVRFLPSGLLVVSIKENFTCLRSGFADLRCGYASADATGHMRLDEPIRTSALDGIFHARVK